MPYTFGIIGDEDSIKSTTFRKNLRKKAEGKQLKNGAFLSANAQNRLNYNRRGGQRPLDYL
jgi:hypothetical protein